MAGWAVPRATSGQEKKQKQPWVLKMDHVAAGVGGVSILGGIFIAAAFAAGRQLLARRSCKGGAGEDENRPAGDEEDRELEIVQKEIHDLVKEIKVVERVKSNLLLDHSELDDHVEQEMEDEQKMEVLDKNTNVDGEDDKELINLSSSNVSQEEEEEEQDYSSEEEEEAEDGNEEDQIKMDELGSDQINPVSSSSSSVESNSEAIWPADVLEEEKIEQSKDVIMCEEDQEEEDQERICKEEITSETMKARARSRKIMAAMSSMDDDRMVKSFNRLLLLLVLAVMLLYLGLLLDSSIENVYDFHHHLRHFQKHSWDFFQTIFAAAAAYI